MNTLKHNTAFKTLRHMETVRNYLNVCITMLVNDNLNVPDSLFSIMDNNTNDELTPDGCSINNTLLRKSDDMKSMYILALLQRGEYHDQSKLIDANLEAFDEVTHTLRGLTYGSPEYQQSLDKLKPTLEDHYRLYPHHPEHYENGITDMSVVDLVEMLCDWIAAGKRHADGDIYKSLEINQKRYGYSDNFKTMLLNTVNKICEFNVCHYANES